MSLIRTGNTPGAWRDEGPARHVPHGHGIRGNTVTGYVPFVKQPMVQSEAERSRQRRRSEALRGERLLDRHRKERPICGAAMRYNETCARTAGHRDSHRSRTVMDTDRASRQAGRRDLVLR
jgi:hypothetical protein